MRPRSSLILLFALAFAAFIILPGLLGQPFPLNPLMHWADALDLLTPLVVISLYWLLLRELIGDARAPGAMLAFVLLSALWVEGQGMHLSANSISNLLGKGSSEVHDLVHFYDEVLSHYLWHLAIIGMSVLLLTRTSVSPEGGTVPWGPVGPAAVLYGFTYFVAVAEGATVPLGLPAALLIVLWLAIWRRQLIGRHNLVAFFLTAYGLALVLFLIWFLIWGYFPEPSAVGIP